MVCLKLINLFAKDYGPKVLAQEFNRFEVINSQRAGRNNLLYETVADLKAV